MTKTQELSTAERLQQDPIIRAMGASVADSSREFDLSLPLPEAAEKHGITDWVTFTAEAYRQAAGEYGSTIEASDQEIFDAVAEVRRTADESEIFISQMKMLGVVPLDAQV